MEQQELESLITTPNLLERTRVMKYFECPFNFFLSAMFISVFYVCEHVSCEFAVSISL